MIFALRLVDYETDCTDLFEGYTPPEMFDNLVKELLEAAIQVRMHDGTYIEAGDVIPLVRKGLENRGFRPVTAGHTYTIKGELPGAESQWGISDGLNKLLLDHNERVAADFGIETGDGL